MNLSDLLQSPLGPGSTCLPTPPLMLDPVSKKMSMHETACRVPPPWPSALWKEPCAMRCSDNTPQCLNSWICDSSCTMPHDGHHLFTLSPVSQKMNTKLDAGFHRPGPGPLCDTLFGQHFSTSESMGFQLHNTSEWPQIANLIALHTADNRLFSCSPCSPYAQNVWCSLMGCNLPACKRCGLKKIISGDARYAAQRQQQTYGSLLTRDVYKGSV